VKFEIDQTFIDKYRDIPAPFGGNGLGEATFYRTYSREDNPRLPVVPGQEDKPEEERKRYMESWHDTVRRVIEGMHTFEMEHCLEQGINYNLDKAQTSAQEAFDLMFHMKWSPPGRGLEHMGAPFVMEDHEVEALQNCAFLSSKNIVRRKGKFFSRLMHLSMMGVGVGFDTEGADKVTVYQPLEKATTWVIPDSREGWAESIEVLINSFLARNQPTIIFDYSLVRPKGSVIRRFGGVASGPEPLAELHESVRKLLSGRAFELLSSRDIVDIQNLIGKCVVSGNVRRSAELAMGRHDDEVFYNLKDYDTYPDRSDFSWLSNNSIVVEQGFDFSKRVPNTWKNGEPGYIWLGNARNYGRMNGVIDKSDKDIDGFNPCVEMGLEDNECCTLVEVYLPNIKDKYEFRRVLKHAYRYAKIVTMTTKYIKDDTTREVMLRNRRIGLSTTGVTQFLAKHHNEINELIDWWESGYGYINSYLDPLYSQWYQIPRSIKTTTIKPSGSVALLPMVTPGIHFSPAGRYFIRRVNMAAGSKLAGMMIELGYTLEPKIGEEDRTWICEFPIDMGEGIINENDVDPFEHLELIALGQKHWSDNGVSATVKFKQSEHDEKSLVKMLEFSETRLKAISFLPVDGNTYQQMPYEEIDEDMYFQRMARIKPFKITEPVFGLHELEDKYCDGQLCEIQSYNQGGF